VFTQYSGHDGRVREVYAIVKKCECCLRNILQGMKFLCAEDNELNAESLTELLKIEGAECTICENGEKIVEVFEQSVPGDYDMILMDIQMPKMDGYKATQEIRNLPDKDKACIPIIAMTANAFAEDVQAALNARMDDHVAKPVDMSILISAITKYIEKAKNV